LEEYKGRSGYKTNSDSDFKKADDCKELGKWGYWHNVCDASMRSKKTIRLARLAKGLTQQELADASEMNIRQIQKLETGETSIKKMTLANALLLTKALGISVDEFSTY
jgi:DNA-binding XRE family transcriptional regulator